MELDSLYDAYSTFASNFAAYNGLTLVSGSHLEKSSELISQKEFNATIIKSKFIVSEYSGEKLNHEAVDLPTESSFDSEEIEGGAKENTAKILLAFCSRAVFESSINYTKLFNTIKPRKNENDKEAIIIYEMGTKKTNIESFIKYTTKSLYISAISIASFKIGRNHCACERRISIVVPSAFEEEAKKWYFSKKNIPEISRSDPAIVYIRARVGDIISVLQNSISAGLSHEYRKVI